MYNRLYNPLKSSKAQSYEAPDLKNSTPEIKYIKHPMFRMLSERFQPTKDSANKNGPFNNQSHAAIMLKSAVTVPGNKSKETERSGEFRKGPKNPALIATAPLSSSMSANSPLLPLPGSTKTLGKSKSKVRDFVKKKLIGLQDINNNFFTRTDIPNGLLPPPIKDCHLTNVLRSVRRCLDQLREVRESMSGLVAEDDQLSKGIKKENPGPDLLQLSQVAETITILSREAFVPAHRLNQTTIALYNAEDFLRYPTDIRTFDIALSGRIRLPEVHFNESTIEKLRTVVDHATEQYNKFNGRGHLANELQDILFTLMRALQDFYTSCLGCQEVFKALLYTTIKERQNLQQFLLSLPSMERSDMLTEVQELRRLVDELVIFLEKLSWGSFVVYRLASGKSITNTSIASAKASKVDGSKVGLPREANSVTTTLKKISKIKGFGRKKSAVSKEQTTGEKKIEDETIQKKKPKSKKTKDPQASTSQPSELQTTTKKVKKVKNKAKSNKDLHVEETKLAFTL